MLTCYNIYFINFFQQYDLITVTYYIFRFIYSFGKQDVPGIAGFIFLTNSLPKIDYYTPIHELITQYETVHKL